MALQQQLDYQQEQITALSALLVRVLAGVTDDALACHALSIAIGVAGAPDEMSIDYWVTVVSSAAELVPGLRAGLIECEPCKSIDLPGNLHKGVS
jgi:hypothetical protein